jgi:hypothetical protein
VAIELVRNEEALGEGAMSSVGEERTPRLRDRLGITGILLEHRLGVSGVRTVEERLFHQTGSCGRPLEQEA